jgi:hypothetical protein
VQNQKPPALIRRADAIISAIAIISLILGYSSRGWSSTRDIATLSIARSAKSDRSTTSSVHDVASTSNLVQGDAPTSDDDADVPPKMVEKYTNAYKAMQKDHNMTAEQAAAAQGLTIAQFRTIEGRIERDDTLRERVRKALRNSTPGAKESSNQ